MNTDSRMVGSEELDILGGQISEQDIGGLIAALPKDDTMAYAICEYSDRIQFTHFAPDDLPKDYRFLERLRIFGPKGDLTLRRDGNLFRWWIVGEKDIIQPNALVEKVEDFFSENSRTRFFKKDEFFLLWGKRKEREGSPIQFWDDRVAGSNLDFPVGTDGERVRISYRTYSRNGHVAFVRFLDVKPDYDLKGKEEAATDV